MCILCKEKQAVGRTTMLYCKDCAKKELFVKMAALQRDTRFKEGATKYKDECWGKEIVIKTDAELSKYLQAKCVSFSPEHYAFDEIVQEVKEINRAIPVLIKKKIEIRRMTKVEMVEINVMIRSLKQEIEKIKDKKGKKAKEKFKDLRDDLKRAGTRKKANEVELKKLEKKK